MNRHAVLAMALLVVAGSASSNEQPPVPISPDLGDADPPRVVTPTRLMQSLAEVPASVTVLTGEHLRSLGIRTVPEALRLVPGMAVTRAAGSDYRIGYHGTNILSPRRMNVLVDGISVYRPAFSEVVWSQLPLAVEDIERIEVTRGPNSASYGPNSMLAVINIITRHPRDVERALGSLHLEHEGLREVTVRGGWRLGDTSVYLTAGRLSDAGQDAGVFDPDGHDAVDFGRLHIRADHPLGGGASLQAQAMFVEGTAEVAYGDDFQQTFPDRHVQDGYASLAWSKPLSENQELHVRLDHARQRVRQSWTTCLPAVTLLPEMHDLWRANPRYADTLLAGELPTGGTQQDDALALRAVTAIRALGGGATAPVCGDVNQDAVQTRTDLEVQDTVVFSERLRLVAGGGLRAQSGESETFLGGRVSSQVQWLFANVEGRPNAHWTYNLGGYLERNSLAPSSFSPRAALNWHATPRDTVRLVVSRGTRSPDIHEQRTDWTYTVRNLRPPVGGESHSRFYQSREGPGNLGIERITSLELGWLHHDRPRGLMVDLKLFNDRLRNLISERTNLAGLVATNDHAVDLLGLEIQFTRSWGPRTSVFLNYAYLDNRHATYFLERTQVDRHSGSVGIKHGTRSGWWTSIAYYGASGDGLQQSPYGRADLTVGRTGRSDGTVWRGNVGLRVLAHRRTSYSNGATLEHWTREEQRARVFVTLDIRFP